MASIPGSQQALAQRSGGLSWLLFIVKRRKGREGGGAADEPAVSHYCGTSLAPGVYCLPLGKWFTHLLFLPVYHVLYTRTAGQGRESLTPLAPERPV